MSTAYLNQLIHKELPKVCNHKFYIQKEGNKICAQCEKPLGKIRIEHVEVELIKNDGLGTNEQEYDRIRGYC